MENQNLDTFERFLKGKMEETEKRGFERRLQQDEQLQKEFSAYIIANDVIEQEVRSDLKNTMNNWKTPSERNWGGLGMISGILVVLLGIALVSIVWMCPQEEEQQWGQYAEVNLEALQRSAGPSDNVRQLNQHYVTGNYTKAQQMIDQMKPEVKAQADVQFIQGLLNYQRDDFRKALAIFTLLKDEVEVHFSISEQAEYYYLLTLIRMEDCTEACLQNLKDIAEDENHLRQIEARKLLNNFSL